MSVFRDAEHLYATLGALFDRMRRDPGIGPSIRKTGLTLRFNYSDPDAAIWVDASRDPDEAGTWLVWRRDDERAGVPDVEMWMRADVAHRFWLGQVNLLTALMKRDIRAKGPIPKILKVLPILKPAYRMYRELIEDSGEHELMQGR